MTDPISNTQDVIDSRDIIDRIKELESMRDDWQTDNDLPDYLDTDTVEGNNKASEWKDSDLEKWGEWDESDEGQELKALLSLQDELEGYCDDWEYGVTLIRESYFVEYTKELLKDVGYINKDFPSWIVIDWDETADNVKEDYTSADFDGVEYWAR